jgi:hypothetical protein
VYATSSDSNWNQRYVNASGDPTATKTWLTDAQIDGLTLDSLSAGVQYRFTVVARNANGDETASSTTTQVTTVDDSSPPTPNPMTFSSAPSNASQTQIDMTATTGTDDNPPISYYFTAVTGSCGANLGTGGTDSGWQSADTTYSDTGLQANKCYAYTVTARDSYSNTGTASAASTTYTSANTPGAPSASSIGTTSFVVTNDANGNPTSNPATTFALLIESTSPTDASHDGKYIDGSGNPSDTAVWLTDTQLDGLSITGLNASTTYTIKVKARNGDSDETAFSATTDVETLAPGSVPDYVRVQGTRLQGVILR